MTIITVVAVVDDDTYYRVYMSSDHTFQVYYKVRQLILLQSATAFLLQSAATVITKRDRYYKVRQNTVLSKVIFFFFSGFILVLRTRLADFILHTSYLSRRIIRLEFDENLSRYFTRVAKI